MNTYKSDAVPPTHKSQENQGTSLSSGINLCSANGSPGATSSRAGDSGFDRCVRSAVLNVNVNGCGGVNSGNSNYLRGT